MTSEIRANTLKNRVGLGTVSYTNTGIVVSGIVTATTFVGNLTGNPTGTLQTAAQPNITSVGTLSALTVSGNINVTNNDPTIVFVDGDNNPDFDIKAGGGRFAIRDSTNNVERLRIDSSGNVIVNNTTAAAGSYTYKLLASDNISSTEQTFGIQYPGVVTYGLNAESNGDFSIKKDGAQRLRITSAGKVGINSISPTYALEVDGGTQNTVIALRSSDAKAAISFLDNTSGGYGRATIGGEGDEVYITSGAGVEALRIKSDGKTIISSPNAVAQTPVAILDVFNQGTTTQALRVYRNDLNDNTLAAFDSYHNALGIVPKMVITSRGRVGINTDNPQREIHVKPWDNNPATAAPGYIRIDSQGSDQAAVLELYHTRSNGSDKWPSSVASVDGGLTLNVANGNNGAPQERLRIDSSGTVLIGAGTNSSLYQAGDGRLIVYADSRLHPAIKVDCIDGGVNRANGFTLLADNYQADESISNYGLSYSGASIIISRAVKVSNSADNSYLSSIDTSAQKPCAIKMDADSNFIFLNTNTSATTTVDSAVTLYERFRITSTGNITFTGPSNSFATIQYASNFTKLDLRGNGIANSYHYLLSYGAGHGSADDFHMVNKTTNGSLRFRTGSLTDERLRIAHDGKILIPGTQTKSDQTGMLDIYHTSPAEIDSPHIRLWGPTNQDARIEFGSETNTGEGGYISYNDADEGLYIGSRMAGYSEVKLCTGMNDGNPHSNARLTVNSVGRISHQNTTTFDREAYTKGGTVYGGGDATGADNTNPGAFAFVNKTPVRGDNSRYSFWIQSGDAYPNASNFIDFTVQNAYMYRVLIKGSHSSATADIAQFLIYGLANSGGNLAPVIEQVTTTTPSFNGDSGGSGNFGLTSGSFTCKVMGYGTSGGTRGSTGTYDTTLRIEYSGSNNQGLVAFIERWDSGT